jgi:succinate dehydrogenase / fumarate reductase membrane anchor subunit
MTGSSSDFRTPLSRARGHGAAKHGVQHFIIERTTSMALVPLSLWAAFAATQLAATGFDGARAWLGLPVNAVLLSLLIVVGFVHLRLAMQVVIEDYIGKFETKTALLVLNIFVCVAGASLGIFAILHTALAGA